MSSHGDSLPSASSDDFFSDRIGAVLQTHLLPMLEQGLLPRLEKLIEACIAQHVRHSLMTINDNQLKFLTMISDLVDTQKHAHDEGYKTADSDDSDTASGNSSSASSYSLNAPARARVLTADDVDKLNKQKILHAAGLGSSPTYKSRAAWKDPPSRVGTSESNADDDSNRNGNARKGKRNSSNYSKIRNLIQVQAALPENQQQHGPPCGPSEMADAGPVGEKPVQQPLGPSSSSSDTSNVDQRSPPNCVRDDCQTSVLTSVPEGLVNTSCDRHESSTNVLIAGNIQGSPTRPKCSSAGNEVKRFDDVLPRPPNNQGPAAQDKAHVEPLQVSKYNQEEHVESTCMRELSWFHSFYSLWGVALWKPNRRAKWYQRGVQFTSTAGALFFMIDLVKQPGRLWEKFAQSAFAISTVVGMLSLQRFYCEHMVDLEQFAVEHGFLHKLVRRSFKYFILVNAAWVSNIVACTFKALIWNQDRGIESMVYLFFSVLLSGTHFAVVHCMCHALTFLGLMLDNYAVKFCCIIDLSQCASFWNTVQAILSKVSCAVGLCFLAVQTSGTIWVLCFAVGMLVDVVMAPGNMTGSPRLWTVLLELPTLMIASFAFLLLVRAAAITETCVRIPTVVNTSHVTGETETSSLRLRVVTFIKHCQAGFSVKGSQVNATVLLNYCYLCGAVVCGIFTTGLSYSRS